MFFFLFQINKKKKKQTKKLGVSFSVDVLTPQDFYLNPAKKYSSDWSDIDQYFSIITEYWPKLFLKIFFCE